MASQDLHSVELMGDRWRLYTQQGQNGTATVTNSAEDVFVEVLLRAPDYAGEPEAARKAGQPAGQPRRRISSRLSNRWMDSKIGVLTFYRWDKIDLELLAYCRSNGKPADWEPETSISDLVTEVQHQKLLKRRTTVVRDGILELICTGHIPCHELRDGRKMNIPFRGEDGEIDPRIQHLIDLRYTGRGPQAPPTWKRLREARASKRKSESENEEFLPGGGRSKKRRSEHVEDDGTAAVAEQEPVPATRARSPMWHPDIIDITETDEDEEVIQPRVPSQELSYRPSRELFTRDRTHIKSEPKIKNEITDLDMGSEAPVPARSTSKLPQKISSREIFQVDSDSEPDTAFSAPKSPRGRRVMHREQAAELQHIAATHEHSKAVETHLGVSQPIPGGNASKEQGAHKSNGKGRMVIKTESGIENQREVQQPAPTTASSNTSQPSKLSSTPAKPTTKVDKELGAQPMGTQGPPAPVPSTNSKLGDRLAIAQLRRTIVSMKHKLATGDQDKVPLQYHFDMATADLEILLLQYQMKYGEEYLP